MAMNVQLIMQPSCGGTAVVHALDLHASYRAKAIGQTETTQEPTAGIRSKIKGRGTGVRVMSGLHGRRGGMPAARPSAQGGAAEARR